jgi:iron complex outermembrane receptor protein
MSSVKFSGALAATGAAASAAFLSLAFTPVSSAAGATDDAQLEEVIVTAERRVGTAQKTAASISVISDDALTARYSLADILEDVPGVEGGAAANTGTSLSGTDNPAAGLVVRGIQSNLGTGGSSISAAAAAALYVDDVYNGIGGNYDIERVEVLRGPQGTLYGRSATSGVVAVHTVAPDLQKFGGDVTVEGGNYGLSHASGALNLPLVDERLALRVSGNYYERDSYYSTTGGGRLLTKDGRAKLLYKPTDNLAITLGIALQDTNTRSLGVSINQIAPDRYRFVSTRWAPITNSYRQYWAVFDLDLGDIALTYIPAYRTWKQDAHVLSLGGVPEVEATAKTPKDNFHTQELRLRSNKESPLQWQTGVAYYDNGLEDASQVNILPANSLAFRSFTKKQTTAMGVFAEATWAFAPTTRVTAGIRYDHTKVVTEQDYTSAALVTKSLTADQGTRKFDNLTYKLRLEQDLTSANLLYAMVSSGFTPGDVALTTNAAFQPEVAESKDETLVAYEVGSKNRFMDDRLQVNGALYYYSYGGFQVANINLNTAPSPVRTFRTITVPVKTYGAELELLARPWKNGEFAANVAYTNARYHDIPAAYDYLFAFNEIPGVAPVEASTSYSHTLPLANGIKLRLSGDVRFSLSHYVSRVSDSWVQFNALAYSRVADKAVGNLNATLSFADGRYSLTGYVRNVTDEKYKVWVPGIGSSIDSATAAGVTSSVNLSDPRTFGLSVSARF